MGLFSFLARRTGNRRKSSAALRAEPFESSLSRARLGGCPVTSSDPSIEDTTFRGRPGFTESQLSLDTASEDEQPAPTPGIPRFREESIERPRTAPTVRPSSVAFPTSGARLKRNGQRRPPPLSFRAVQPDTTASGDRPGSRGSIRTFTSALRRMSGQSRANSLRSDGVGAFKDILDAQSEIKPADFRERVKATGARDYGEDVAERNMGENGFDLEAEHVQAFYTQSRRAQPNKDGLALAEVGFRADAYRAGARRRPLRSSQISLPRRISSMAPMSPSVGPTPRGDFGRPRSVNTYMPLAIKSLVAPPQPDPENLEDIPWPPAPELGRLDFGFSALESATPAMPHLSAAAPAPTVRTARLPRDSVELARKRTEMLLSEGAVGDDAPASNFALWSATRARRPLSSLSATSVSRRNHSLYTLRSSDSSSIASRDTLRLATPLSCPHKTAVQQARDAQEDSVLQDIDALTAASAPAPCT